MYLREIGKVPLLTAAQEVDLAMRIEGGQLAADLLAAMECLHQHRTHSDPESRAGRGRKPEGSA
jgi:hypothetical protein